MQISENTSMAASVARPHEARSDPAITPKSSWLNQFELPHIPKTESVFFQLLQVDLTGQTLGNQIPSGNISSNSDFQLPRDSRRSILAWSPTYEIPESSRISNSQFTGQSMLLDISSFPRYLEGARASVAKQYQTIELPERSPISIQTSPSSLLPNPTSSLYSSLQQDKTDPTISIASQEAT